MGPRATLRLRVALLCSILCLVLGGIFAGAVYWQTERLEHELVEATLKRTLDGLVASGASVGPGALPRDIAYFRADDARVPPYFRDLPVGLHELDVDGRSFEVLVERHDGVRRIVALDETRNDIVENRVYTGTVLAIGLGVLLVGVIGYYAAARALAPLNHFAARVEQLGPRDDRSELAADYAGTEVEAIAESLDRYRRQLGGFIQREREFTADASHELRTPLAVIQGAAELLRLPNLHADRRASAARRIERAAGQMSEILTALLFLAREQVGQAPEPAGASRIDEVAVDLVENYRALAKDRGVRLELHVDEPVSVAADRALVAIVLGNLLDNAMRHTEEGSVSVSVESNRVRIADTGGGIPAEELPFVFERHYRGGGHDGGPGAGIGLSIARRVCELHGWDLTLDSELGHGVVAILRFGDAETPAS